MSDKPCKFGHVRRNASGKCMECQRLRSARQRMARRCAGLGRTREQANAARRKLHVQVGQRFGRLTVLCETPKIVGGHRYARVRCDCGRERDIDLGRLIAGEIYGCVCLRRERATIHGMYRHPVNKIWHSMLTRCRNPKSSHFECYGGRGIKVCDRWQLFANFWADMGPSWQPGLSIDRIDNDGDYEPGNCRWTTQHQQVRNSRKARMVDAPFGRMCMTDAARHIGITPGSLMKRLNAGWPTAELFRTAQPRRRGMPP